MQLLLYMYFSNLATRQYNVSTFAIGVKTLKIFYKITIKLSLDNSISLFIFIVNIFYWYNYNTKYFLASFVGLDIPAFLKRILSALRVRVSPL